MRIGWVSHRDIEHPNAGGVERAIFEVAQRLAAAGHDIDWLSVAPPGARTQDVRAGVTLKRFVGSNLVGHALIPWYCKAKRYELIVDDLGHAVPWGTPWVSGTPAIATFHHLHRRTLPAELPLALAAMGAAAEYSYRLLYPMAQFVVPSESSRRDLESVGVRPRRIVVINPGVDSNLFVPGQKSARPSVVYFGGLRRYKRPSLALETFAIVARTRLDATLYVVGSGEEDGHLREVVHAAGIQDRVAFTGRLDRGALASLLGSAWVNLHTSLAEGWCLSALEAAAAGVPTVSCSVPGVRDSVAQGVSGLLVDEGMAQDLALATLQVLDSPDSWTSPCRAHALNFSWQTTASRWEALVRSVAG